MSPSAQDKDKLNKKKQTPEETEPVAKKQRLNLEEEKLLNLIEKEIELEGEKKLPAKVIRKESEELEEGEVEIAAFEERQHIKEVARSKKISEKRAELGIAVRRNKIEQELIKTAQLGHSTIGLLERLNQHLHDSKTTVENFQYQFINFYHHVGSLEYHIGQDSEISPRVKDLIGTLEDKTSELEDGIREQGRHIFHSQECIKKLTQELLKKEAQIEELKNNLGNHPVSNYPIQEHACFDLTGRKLYLGDIVYCKLRNSDLCMEKCTVIQLSQNNCIYITVKGTGRTYCKFGWEVEVSKLKYI